MHIKKLYTFIIKYLSMPTHNSEFLMGTRDRYNLTKLMKNMTLPHRRVKS